MVQQTAYRTANFSQNSKITNLTNFFFLVFFFIFIKILQNVHNLHAMLHILCMQIKTRSFRELIRRQLKIRYSRTALQLNKLSKQCFEEQIITNQLENSSQK